MEAKKADHYPRMTALAHSFPTFARKFPGPWDALAVLNWVLNGGGSHGEKVVGRFLLGVWNPLADWAKCARENEFKRASTYRRFDVFEAMGVWDGEHVAAFQAWIVRPYWP